MRAQRAGQREIYETVAYYVQHLVASQPASQEGGLGPVQARLGRSQFILISLACPKGSTRERAAQIALAVLGP